MADPGLDATARGTDDRGTEDKGTNGGEQRPIQGPISTKSTTTAAPADSRVWRPVFTPGDAHNHQPCGRWAEIQQRPVTVDLRVDQICRYGSPAAVVKRARQFLSGNLLAIEHLNHYLSGSGRDMIEDEHFAAMLRSDAGVRARLAAQLKAPSAGDRLARGWIMLEQKHYANEDFLYSFGGIDRLDYELDQTGKSVRVWFQDRYEWHPVYEGFYDRQPGDVIRDNNCLHAAMVEMKLEGAADFWMKGKAVISLDTLPAPDAEAPSSRTERW
jgi:hypothetical protein